MENGGKPAVNIINELSDLELAALICLVCNQHCIIRTPSDLLDGLEGELQLVWAY